MARGVMRDPARLARPTGPSTDEIAPVWVLDDPRDALSDRALAVADRLGVPHLRVPLAWSWRAPFLRAGARGSLRGIAGAGSGPPWPFCAPSGPALAIAAGPLQEPVALWLRSTFGTRVVHCSMPPGGWRARRFDLLVVPRHDRPPPAANVLPTLGVPHRLSPLVMSQARTAWAARLAHLPRPVLAVLVGGGPAGDLSPAVAFHLARRATELASRYGGSVVATTTKSTGELATQALAAGLGSGMHLLYRWGEPGDNPYEGMLALADAVVVTGSSAAMVCEACASEAPVLIASNGDGAALRRLHTGLYRAGQARPLGDTLAPWPRSPLDEAGRVATEIRARMSIGPHAVD